MTPQPKAPSADAVREALTAISDGYGPNHLSKYCKHIADVALAALSPALLADRGALARMLYCASTAGDGEYQIKIGFASLKDMQDAHAALAAQPVVVDADILPAETIAWSVIDHHQLPNDLHPILVDVIRRARNDTAALSQQEPGE